MAKRNWNEVLREIHKESKKQLSESNELSNSSSLQELLRDKVINQLSAEISPMLQSGRSNQISISDEIDKALDAVAANAERDGVDIDPELIEYLVELSGSLHAIESAWQRLISLTNI